MSLFKSFLCAASLTGLAVSFAAAQPNLAFFPIGSQQSTTFSRAISLPNGNRLLIGSISSNGHLQIVLSSMTSSGANVEVGTLGQPLPGGHGNDMPTDVGVDPSGNVWIVGSTDSDDFTLVNPIVATKIPYRQAAFVLEMDPTVSKVLFSTYLSGQQRGNCSSAAAVVSFDTDGNTYVGGSTDEIDFPITTGAYLTKGGGCANAFGETHSYSFLTKISPAGKLVYSTYLSTGTFACSGGSGCIGRESTSASVVGLAVDSTGAATIAETRSFSPAMVSRMSPDGSKLLWSTQVTGYQSLATAMAQDSSGSAYLLFEYGERLVGFVVGTFDTFGLAATKIGNDGSITYTLDLGHVTPIRDRGQVHVYGVLVDSSGNAYYAGSSTASAFPQLSGAPNLGADFILQLDPTGTTAKKLFSFPTGVLVARPAIDAGNNLLLLGAQGALVTLPTSYNFDSPVILGFANSGSFAWNTGIYPGTLVSIFGYDLGPAQVSVNTVNAPVIYTGSTQLNAIVPFGISEQSPFTSPEMILQVGFPTAAISVKVPGIFSIGLFTTDGYHAAALNQDGTVNSAANPAAAGTIVSVFGTGAIWPPDLQKTGAFASGAEALDPASNGFVVASVLGVGNLIAPLYWGAAPGEYIGVFQANVQLPPLAPPLASGPIALERLVNPLSGNPLSSNSVTVYVK